VTSGTEGVPEVLFDTDVLIEHLLGERPIVERYAGSAYSSITRAELYSGRGAEEAIIDRLLAAFDEISVDQRVAEEAGRIRRVTGLRLPDALIAATAVVIKRPLYTRNFRDFRVVKTLSLHRP
jgi:toxin FitB